MTAPALRALRPAATTSAFAGDGLRPQAPAPSRVAATSRTRDMAVRVRTVARRAPPRVAAGARDPRVSIAPAARRRAPLAPPRAVRDPGVAVEQAAEPPAAVQPSETATRERSAAKRAVSSAKDADIRSAKPANVPIANAVAFERGVPFSLGRDASSGQTAPFYRAESAQARDLAVLLARTLDRPRVLDAMAGSGVRSARYLRQGRAAHVHLNDASPDAADALLATLDALFSPPADDAAFSFDVTIDDATNDVEEVEEDDLDSDASSFASSLKVEAEMEEACDPNEAEDFASAVRCLPNPHEKPHPFKKTKRGKKTMSRQEKKALMESKMQRTKLFKLTKVTKKERRLRQEAAAAAEPEPDSEPEPDGDDDEARAIQKAMARAEAEKKKQRRRSQQSLTDGVAAETTAEEDSEKDSENDDSESKDSSLSRDASSLGTVSVTSKDARVLFASLFASNAERFDVVDVDSFGSEVFVDDALRVTKLGGYCYVTSTDALALCGKNPPRLMSRYGGAYVAPNAPAVNETGLRVFVGDAVRRGVAQGLKVTPVFSLFHPHGPVFRAMLHVEKLKGTWNGENVGFLAQCDACGETRETHEEAESFHDGSPCFCRRCGGAADPVLTGKSGQSMAVSGPMWTGPLHDAAAVRRLAREAEEVDWSGAGEASSENDDASLENEASPMKGQKASARELLAAFAAEADPALPPFYRRTDELARAGRGLEHGIPPLDEWVAELQRRGFAACRSHVDARGLKSDAPMDDVLAAGNAVANAAKNEP